MASGLPALGSSSSLFKIPGFNDEPEHVQASKFWNVPVPPPPSHNAPATFLDKLSDQDERMKGIAARAVSVKGRSCVNPTIDKLSNPYFLQITDRKTGDLLRVKRLEDCLKPLPMAHPAEIGLLSNKANDTVAVCIDTPATFVGSKYILPIAQDTLQEVKKFKATLGINVPTVIFYRKTGQLQLCADSINNVHEELKNNPLLREFEKSLPKTTEAVKPKTKTPKSQTEGNPGWESFQPFKNGPTYRMHADGGGYWDVRWECNIQ